MEIGVAQVAAAAASLLAPFMPFLIETGKVGGKKLTEVVAEQGGEATWDRAQSLWKKISDRWADDIEVKSAAGMVASDSESNERRAMLSEVLDARLNANPAFAQELLGLLGGREAIQEVLAKRGGSATDIRQSMRGTARQIVEADEQGMIKGVDQKYEG